MSLSQPHLLRPVIIMTHLHLDIHVAAMWFESITLLITIRPSISQYHIMPQTSCNRTSRLLEHLPLRLAMLFTCWIPHASELLNCVIDLLGNQPILYQCSIPMHKLVSQTRSHRNPDHSTQCKDFALCSAPMPIFSPLCQAQVGTLLWPERASTGRSPLQVQSVSSS